MSESSHDSTAPAGARDCPNCGRARPESFCPQCGQSDRYYARSLGSVAVEFLRDMFELDSRLFRTLKLLMFRPGSLTREFSRNRRVSFVSPVRLYIFASFAFFLLLSLFGDFGEMVVMGVTEEDREIAATQPPTEERLAAFTAALPPEQRRKADDILGRSEDDLGRQAVLFVASAGDFEERSWIERFGLLEMIDMFHDPSVIPRRFIENMPIAMFCLLPFLGLVLAAFHFRKKRFYVEHLVFAIHFQTFTFCVFAVALLLPDSGLAGWIRAGFILIPYPYFVVALRRYYENGWILTVAKSVGAYMLYSLVLIPASVISVFVTG
ncbi:DUF3667 domain-containing protein [Candidatus Palauibacter sp.]|uniref:DUF3667 domain-containing protein n=1 Tax=Candidatus Palauibacter sp. TaxID=3101350 RepID=UPI003AF2B865